VKIQVPQPALRASHDRQKGWKTLGWRRRGGSELEALRLAALHSGKVQAVLLSQGDAECNWKEWKQLWKNTKGFKSVL